MNFIINCLNELSIMCYNCKISSFCLVHITYYHTTEVNHVWVISHIITELGLVGSV